MFTCTTDTSFGYIRYDLSMVSDLKTLCMASLFDISETESRLPLFFSVVFMGSEKYPDENAFDAFIKKHGGSDNASTDCERVCYMCILRKFNYRDNYDTTPLMINRCVTKEQYLVQLDSFSMASRWY